MVSTAGQSLLEADSDDHVTLPKPLTGWGALIISEGGWESCIGEGYFGQGPGRVLGSCSEELLGTQERRI